jgi:hypothetical protein
MVFTLKALALIVFFVYVHAFTPLPLAASVLHTPGKSPLRRVCRTMHGSSIVSPANNNETKTDLENDIFWRMEEWKSYNSEYRGDK